MLSGSTLLGHAYAWPAAADGADILRHVCWTAIDWTTLLGQSHSMRSKLLAKATLSNVLACASVLDRRRLVIDCSSSFLGRASVHVYVLCRADQAIADAIHSRTVHWPS